MIFKNRLLGFVPLALFLALAGMTSGCATSMKSSAFADATPRLDPADFFTGHTRSWGVFETRDGTPTQRFSTETRGHWEGAILCMEQDLIFENGRRQHRSWRMRRIDSHHYLATANDMIGDARGQAWGNAFTWSFTLALSPGNPLSRVRMTQWMYLQSDGRTLVNRDTIRKAGIVVAQVTEQFRKEPR